KSDPYAPGAWSMHAAEPPLKRTAALLAPTLQPVQKAGQVPGPSAEQAHRAGEDDDADDGRVEEERDGDAEAHLLEHDELASGEADEDHDDDQGRPGDDEGGRSDAGGHRRGGIAARVIALADATHEEDLVVHREAEEDREEEEGHPGFDGGCLLEAVERGADPVDEDEGQQAVGGAHREEVEQDRDDGDDEGAEGDHEDGEGPAEDG